MKKIFPKKQRGPMMLMDKVFNIPIFNAATQQYVCTEVADLGSDANSKKYGVYFRWLPTSYNVPEILRMDITIGPTEVIILKFSCTKNIKVVNMFCNIIKDMIKKEYHQ